MDYEDREFWETAIDMIVRRLEAIGNNHVLEGHLKGIHEQLGAIEYCLGAISDSLESKENSKITVDTTRG